MTRLKIERRGYSAAPWRIVTEDGREVTFTRAFDHPHLGWTAVSEPLAADTRTALVDKVLELIVHQQARLDHLTAEVEALRLANGGGICR